MSENDQDPDVIVLKTKAFPLHSGTVGVARTMGRLGVPVHVFGDDAGSPIARSRYVHSVRPLPAEDLSADDLVRWLIESAPRGRPVLLPMDDVGAILLSDRCKELLGHYRFTELPAGLVATLCDKVGLSRLADEAGVPTPTSSTPESDEELAALIAAADFPVVVKARDPRLLRETPGAKSVDIAHDPDSLRTLWRRHLVQGRSNCMVQEYLPGGPETVWMVNAYVDETSRMHLATTGRKIRQRPPYTGATTMGVCERNDDVLALTAQLVEAISYRGVLDIGFRFDARDGRYKVLDLNPRVGATFRLFAATNGADVVRAHYADLTGRPLPVGEVADGRRWVSEFHDLGVAHRYIRDGATTPLGYLRSLREADEFAWCAADDIRPALTAMRAALLTRGRRSQPAAG